VSVMESTSKEPRRRHSCTPELKYGSPVRIRCQARARIMRAAQPSGRADRASSATVAARLPRLDRVSQPVIIAAAALLRGYPPDLRQQPRGHELQLPYQGGMTEPHRHEDTGEK
jgi:hypothetical protein